MKNIIFPLLLAFFLNTAYSQTFYPKVKFETTAGTITIELYDNTPMHGDNFTKLINEGYYNNQLFHRVIKDFMIQAGDPDSKNAHPGEMLGRGGPGYTIPAEFVKEYYHKRGAR
jgi:cyclophilin family peptidyl-prolyl cis-trans isomerase